MRDDNVNARYRRILEMVMATTGFISLDQIAAELKLSRRSIYYEICRVNEWLEANGLEPLAATRGKGYHLSPEQKRGIDAVIERSSVGPEYVFSPTERVQVIICLIITSGSPVYVEDLETCCKVSRNTIFGDLRAVTNQLQEYNLRLEYDPKGGYRVEGDCVRIRAIFFLYFNMLRPLFERHILTFAEDEQQILAYHKRLQRLESELHVTYVEGILLGLAALMPLMVRGDSRLTFPGLNVEELRTTREYPLVVRAFPELSQDEQTYLCLHLLGSRLAAIPDEAISTDENQTVYELAKALVDEFERVSCVEFEEREKLERNLFVHISSSMYRYTFGVQIGNPFMGEMSKEYATLFELTRVVCGYFEQRIGLPISDDEVAYLAMHFGAHLRSLAKDEGDVLRVLIVCVNGISTGNMLKSEVAKLLPQARIVAVVSAAGIQRVVEPYDLVISTTKVTCSAPVVVVSPILRDLDRANIVNHPVVRRFGGHVDVDGVFDVVKKYVPEMYHESLRIDLNSFFQKEVGEALTPTKRSSPGLCDMLDEERVLLLDRPMGWEELIRVGGENMVRRGSVEPRYLETIISQIRHYGTFMFITPDVILAHCKPEDGVRCLDVSLTALKQPVRFSSYREARMMITLAAEDQERHLKILRDVLELVSVDDAVSELVACGSAAELLACLRSRLA